MAELYLRKVVLDILSQKGDPRRIEALRIKFSCEKTNESKPNNSKIEIYNISDKTKALLEAKNTRVRLQIGYLGIPKSSAVIGGLVSGLSGNVETVFIGNVTKTVHKVESGSPDIITTVEVSDGGNRFRNATLDKGYPPNTKLKNVFDELIEELGVQKGSVVGIPDKNFSNGLTLSGTIRDHLDTLTKTHKLEWSIQDETIQIIPQTQFTIDSVIELDSDSGLIGSPSKTAKGVEFTSLIQPRLKPGRKIKIESRLLKGIFKIRRVTHEGDSHQGDFLSKCEATR